MMSRASCCFAVCSYGSIATPSLAPDASPFMTWGEIESTPLRLDAYDEPLLAGMMMGDATPGPSFELQKASRKEVVGRKLAARKAGTGLTGPVGLPGGAGHGHGGGAVGGTPLLASLRRTNTPALSPAAR